MKLNLVCETCRDELVQKIRALFPDQSFPSGPLPTSVSITLTDERVYRLTCRQGHSVAYLLTNERHEILFDLGICAIGDGYTREAVLSFYGSLEKFREFWVRCAFLASDVPTEEANKALRRLNRSERLLGAFEALYTARYKRSPETLREDTFGKLRNQVAHAGKIPSHEEAIAFGNAVLAVLRPQIEELARNHQAAVALKMRLGLEAERTKLGESHRSASEFTMQTVLGGILDGSELAPASVADVIDEVCRFWSEWGKR